MLIYLIFNNHNQPRRNFLIIPDLLKALRFPIEFGKRFLLEYSLNIKFYKRYLISSKLFFKK